MFDTSALFAKPEDAEDGKYNDPIENNLTRSIRSSFKGSREEMN